MTIPVAGAVIVIMIVGVSYDELSVQPALDDPRDLEMLHLHKHDVTIAV